MKSSLVELDGCLWTGIFPEYPGYVCTVPAMNVRLYRKFLLADKNLKSQCVVQLGEMLISPELLNTTKLGSSLAVVYLVKCCANNTLLA